LIEGGEGTLKPGDTLNSTYRIEALVGLGGTGEVYLATNVAQGSEVAVKVLKREFATDERFVQLLQREASVLDSIVDDAVVRYYGLQKTSDFGGLVFLVTEFIRGPSLAHQMESGPVPAADLVHVARRSALGLKAAHGRGVFHRDLSPDNILLRDGDASRAVLIDFGIAKDMESDGKTVAQGGFLGKYEYAAIDQIHGQVDARSDVYSLGMTLLAAFHGRHPRFDSYDAMLDSKSQVPPLDKVPQPLRGLIERMIQPRPKDRFQSAEEILAAIDGDGAIAAPAAPPEDLFPKGGAKKKGAAGKPDKKGARPPPPAAKKGGMGGAIAAVVLVALMGGGGWFFGMGPGKEMIFGPSLPLATPYRLTASVEGGAGSATGDAPSEAAQASMTAALSAATGGTVTLRLASGVPSDTWAEGVSALATAATALEDWKLDVIDARVALRGTATDAGVKDKVGREAGAAARTAGLRLDLRIEVPERTLALADLRAIASDLGDCGPLEVRGGDGRTLATGQPATVRGLISTDEARATLERALTAKLDGRPLDLQVATRTNYICAFERILPADADGGMKVDLILGADPRREGGRTGPNPSGVFKTDENPVVDIIVPASMQGHLHVYHVDTEGKVHHTFPQRDAPENRVERIQPIAVDGVRTIRVAHSVQEIFDAPETAPIFGYTVSPPYGLEMVIAILSEDDVIPKMLPDFESSGAVIEDLVAALNASGSGTRLTARQIIRTEEAR
jgi:serine/threonine-protein kinase